VVVCMFSGFNSWIMTVGMKSQEECWSSTKICKQRSLSFL